MKAKSIGWVSWLFGIIIVSYTVVLPAGANFGVIDDHIFLTTLLSNRILDLKYCVIPSIGRFFPLVGQEYNIVSLFSSLPVAFFMYNAFQFVVVVLLVLKILSLCLPDGKSNKNIYYGIVFLMIFSPGFVTAWFRLFMGERAIMVFFLVFFLMYLFYQKEQKNRYLFWGIVAANLALYYKEPAFLMLGAFGFFHFIFGWKMLNAKQKLFDALIMISAMVFFLVYFFFVLIKKGAVSYGDTPYNPLITFGKNVFSYTLSDPFLMVLLFGLLVYRFYKILLGKEKLNPFYDAALLAGGVYVLVFLRLNMFNFHYLLPAYVFAAFGLVHFLLREEYIKRRLCKVLVCFAFSIYIFNAFPVALHLISYHKNVPNTFQNTLAFLTNYIGSHKTKEVIYLDGVDRGGGMEIYISFAGYLVYKGISPDQFDFKSDIPSRNSVLFSKGDPKSPFTIFRDPGISQIEPGDLLVVTPYTSKFVDQEFLGNIKSNYDLLYHAKSTLAIPNVGIKSLVKYCLNRYHNRKFSDDIMFSNNIFLWPDFYVFRKK